MQQAYLEGLSEEEGIPFRLRYDVSARFRPGEDPAPGMAGPVIRKDVDGGADVINLTAMIAELEAARRAKGGGEQP